MKKIILIFLFIIVSDFTFAQGTYKDQNTGLTIDYPAGWTYTFHTTVATLSTDSGLIIIDSQFNDNPMSAEDFVNEINNNEGMVRLLVSASFGADCDLIESGLIDIAGVPSYYLIVEMDEDFDTDIVTRVKVKDITVNYNNYKLKFTILSAKKVFDIFLPQAEELLKTAYFSE